MPPRTPLGSISGNERRWKDLTPYQRGLIIGKFECGFTPTEVAADLKIPLQTIRDTIKFHPERTDGQSKTRSRPRLMFETFYVLFDVFLRLRMTVFVRNCNCPSLTAPSSESCRETE